MITKEEMLERINKKFPFTTFSFKPKLDVGDGYYDIYAGDFNTNAVWSPQFETDMADYRSINPEDEIDNMLSEYIVYHLMRNIYDTFNDDNFNLIKSFFSLKEIEDKKEESK